MTLTDHQLNVIIAICAVLALVISIAIYFLQKGRKSLSFRITSFVNLLSRKEELEGKVKIFYETIEVKNLQILTICFTNSGKIAIVKSDFDEPLKISFPSEVNILSAQITSTFPENLTVDYTYFQNILHIDPMLLNSKESFKLKIILTGQNPQIQVDARIKDISKVKETFDDSPYSPWISYAIAIMTIVSLVVISFAPGDSRHSKEGLFLYILEGLMVVLSAGLIIVTNKFKMRRRAQRMSA